MEYSDKQNIAIFRRITDGTAIRRFALNGVAAIYMPEHILHCRNVIINGKRSGTVFKKFFSQKREQEGHHPDLHINYRRVTIELTTHAIKGLSENDFMMAEKINELTG
jgi:hypothetical protein